MKEYGDKDEGVKVEILFTQDIADKEEKTKILDA